MDILKTRGGRILGIALAGLYSLYYAGTSTQWHFIDTVDLIFHEAGHTIFFFLGEFMQILMGSGFQILLPLSIAVYFFYHGQRISGAVVFMWIGMNLINVSVYARDSISMQLPLLGGDGVMHDWNYLLSTLHVLQWTPLIAASIYGLGVIAIGAGIALALLFVFER